MDLDLQCLPIQPALLGLDFVAHGLGSDGSSVAIAAAEERERQREFFGE